ncbi:protein-L-isoaspartate O-methyltransferase [Candidatus Pacearchaeota archaeon]|nr:protein-L-isoaspartate O-methyltransferase [Candidatus Pacearchaeota archaeon]
MNKSLLLKSLRGRGFPKQVINAFSRVKREDFVLQSLRDRAYEDIALPIGHGQTISQPYTIGMMLDLLSLKKGQKVLEIGSGCGYVLALLSEIVGKKGEVFGVEIVESLADKSKINLQDYDVKVYNQNGAEGLGEHAPYDRILISAGCESVPDKVLEQLKEDGILVAPVGSRFEQTLTVMKRVKDNFKVIEEVPGFVFVRFV